jgi:hypothetical protein
MHDHKNHLIRSQYVYKNDDQTILRIDENNEIVRHLHERYIDSTQIV